MPHYLTVKDNTFYFRQSVPQKLRPIVGKREIKKSLGHDYIRAVSECKRYAVIADQLIADARTQLDARPIDPYSRDGIRRTRHIDADTAGKKTTKTPVKYWRFSRSTRGNQRNYDFVLFRSQNSTKLAREAAFLPMATIHPRWLSTTACSKRGNCSPPSMMMRLEPSQRGIVHVSCEHAIMRH